ncbi:hypothetical protein Tco_0206426 [Tanacetum coccineum]
MKFAMNRLKLDKITKADLVGPVYKLLKGTCKSNIELEYNMDQCYNALTDQLDWTNLEGDICPYDLSKLLPLQGSLGHLTIPVDFIFNEMIPRQSQINRISKYDVYSTMKILSLIRVKVDKQYGYGYLEEIVVRRAVREELTFKEGDFSRLNLNDIEDMLLLHVQNKLFNLPGDDIVDLLNALCMFTQSLVIKKRVKDVQLGVQSYQKKLNVTKPQKEFPGISYKESHTSSYDLNGVVYLNSRKQKRLMWVDELYKFSGITLKSVHEILHYKLLNFKFGYNKDMPKYNAVKDRGFNTTSWKSCQGDSSKLNLPDQSVQDEAFQGRVFDSFQDKGKYEHVGPKVTSPQEGKRLQDDEEMTYD